MKLNLFIMSVVGYHENRTRVIQHVIYGTYENSSGATESAHEWVKTAYPNCHHYTIATAKIKKAKLADILKSIKVKETMNTFTGAFALIELDLINKPTGLYRCADEHHRPNLWAELADCPLCNTPFLPESKPVYPNWYDVVGDDDSLSTIKRVGYDGIGLKDSQLIVVSNRHDGTSLQGDLIILSPEQITHCLETFQQKFIKVIKDLPHVKSYQIYFGSIFYYE